MATPPNKTYKWAIDSVFDTSVGPSGSPWHGENNKVLPVASRVSQGYVPSQSLDAESLNYLFNSHGDWIGFLSESQVSASADIADINEFLSGTNINSETEEWTYYLGNAKQRSRIFHPLQLDSTTTGASFANDSFYLEGGANFRSRVDLARLNFNPGLFLPSGSLILKCKALVRPGTARSSGLRMVLRYTETIPDFDVPDVPLVTSINISEDDGTTDYQIIGNVDIGIEVDQSTKTQFFSIICGTDSGTNHDRIFALQITYLDYGPRGWT